MKATVLLAAALTACSVPRSQPIVVQSTHKHTSVSQTAQQVTTEPEANGNVIAAEAKPVIASAIGYAAWKRAKPKNIDTIADLMVNVTDTISTMNAHKFKGRYRRVDVKNAQNAVKSLQSFLHNKDD